ncbi:MAG: trypsin-like peptidase domain-containing protein [Planctomycetota bacterium]
MTKELDELVRLKEATCLIESDGARGSGYCVREDRVVTCYHVVADTDKSGNYVKDSHVDRRISMRFPSGTVEGVVLKGDPVADVALIGLDEPVDVTPLTFGAGGVQRSDRVLAYGFPGTHETYGLPFDGVVSDPACAAEHGMLLHLSQVGAGLAAPVAGASGGPVISGGRIVGHMASIILDPSSVDVGRPAFGYLYATRVDAIVELLDFAPTQAQRPGASPALPSNPAGLLKRWEAQPHDQPKDIVLGHFVAERLIEGGARHWLTSAQKILNETPQDSLRTKQLQALLHVREQNDERALEILEELCKELDRSDAESVSMLAGVYKRMGLHDPAFRQRAFGLYHRVFEKFRSPYAGVNAAALALWHDEIDHDHKILAEAVLKELEGKPERDFDHWDFATRAECHLIRERLKDARSAYRKAIAAGAFLKRALVTMRRQAMRTLAHFGMPTAELDDVLPVPRLATFTGHLFHDGKRGRLTPALVPAVTREIAARIRKHKIQIGYTSAADGCDLLFCEELLKEHGRLHVFLPFSAERFARDSVTESWRGRFDKVLKKAHVEVQANPPTPADGGPEHDYRKVNHWMRDAAREEAALLDPNVPALMLAVLNSRDEKGIAADAVRDAQGAGLEMEVIYLEELAADGASVEGS